MSEFTHIHKVRRGMRSTPFWADKTVSLHTEKKTEMVWWLFVPVCP